MPCGSQHMNITVVQVKVCLFTRNIADKGFDIQESVGLFCSTTKIPAFTKGKKQIHPHVYVSYVWPAIDIVNPLFARNFVRILSFDRL